MSVLLKVVGIGIVGMIIALLLKEVKPSFATLVVLSTCIIISIILISAFENILEQFNGFFQKINLSNNMIKTALKVVGVGYIIEFASDIVEENGFSSIAKKIVFCGKVIILAMCLPFVLDLFETILKVI